MSVSDKQIRERVFEDVLTTECPACKSPAGRGCEYADGALHDGWVHEARTIAHYTANPGAA